ncbi:MAG: hypothetical protein NXI10_12025 [bacterium]|nr:hypothetical protein [bacterium]
MKKSLLFLSVAAVAILFVAACNKTNQRTKRLIKGGEWTVTELSVDGVNEAELPKWEISDCDPYEAVCIGKWENEEGGHADFAWQFNNEGTQFIVSHQAEEHEHEGEHDHASEEAAEQAFHFSGTYEVLEYSKTKMKFSSTTTEGYAAQTAVIVIEKK